MIDIDNLFDSGSTSKDKKLEYGVSLINDVDIWIDKFKQDLKLLNRSKNTIDSYSFTLKAFSEYCTIYLSNKKGLCDVEVNHCNDFLLWMENYETNKRYGSLQERITALAKFISFAKDREGDLIELREEYLRRGIPDIKRVEFALSEFEDYYYDNEIPFSRIDNNYIVNYIVTLPKASVTTMMNRRAALHKFFIYITEETETDCFKDVLKKMKQYKKQKGNTHKSHQAIDEEKMQRFLDLLEKYTESPSIVQQRVRKNSKRVAYRDVAMILLMYRAGLRVSEALNIRLVDLEDMGSSYRVNVIGGKGNKNRTTYIKKVYFEKYYNYFKAELTEPTEFLSQSSNGKQLNRRTLYKNVKKLFETLEKEDILNNIKSDSASGLHIFRHLFGSEFAAKNGNMKILQDLLGHSVITTTMIYSDVGERSKQEAVDF